MNRMFLSVVVAAVMFTGHVSAENLHDVFKDSTEIKVFLKSVANESGLPDVKVDQFKKAFKDALTDRLNVQFMAVQSEKEADIVVEANIVDYVYKNKVMPRFYSAYSLVADVSAPKNYAKIVVDYKVLEPVSGKKLLHYKRFTTEEQMPRDTMDEDMTFVGVSRKNADRFLFRAFYKKRSERL